MASRLLNLHDPVPGPILIAGDAGTGKTTLLQTIASAAGKMHQPEELQFGVLTSHPEEWSGLEDIPNNVGVFPLYHKSSEDFILSLASWAHGNKTSKQSVIAFDWMILDAASQYWISMHGKICAGCCSRTGTPGLAHHHAQPQPHGKRPPWLEAFHTRIFGKIQNPQHVANWMLKMPNWILLTLAHNSHCAKETTGFDFGYQV